MADPKSVAIAFLEAFPEAETFSVTLLTPNKTPVISVPVIVRQALFSKLAGFVQKDKCHFLYGLSWRMWS